MPQLVPYPTAPPLNIGNKPLFFIQRDDATLISLTKSIGKIVGEISVRI
jgi:hypothetical protein